MECVFKPIGEIRSPFTDPEGMPIQPTGAKEVEGEIVLDPELAPGLKDLDGFSHLILLYFFHQSEGYKLTVKPFMDTEPRGLFATRAPRRPNPLGLSIVELLAVEGNVLRIRGVDVLDKTPLMDIKPYVPKFDAHPQARCGWLETAAHKAETMRSDDRFQP